MASFNFCFVTQCNIEKRNLAVQVASSYTFSQLKCGQFNSQSSYGFLELHKFCGKAVIQEGSEEKDYRASVFYLRRETLHWEIYFAVTLNTSPHLRVSLNTEKIIQSIVILECA